MAVPAQRIPSTLPQFNKFRWENRFVLAVQRGAIDYRKGMFAMVLRRSLGTAAADCHVPIVWRRADALADLCGVSPPTFRKYRDELASSEVDLLFQIPSGLGSRRTLIILKMPGQTETEALNEARSALEAFGKREGKNVPSFVYDAVNSALEDREAAATAEPAEEPKTEQMKDSLEANKKSFGLPLYNKKRTKPYREGSGRDMSERAHEAPDEPSETQKSDQTEDKPMTETTRTVVDFETVKVIKATIVEMFEEYGRRLDEGVAVRLAKTYSRRGATPNDLRCTLDAKLMRLFGDGYGTGRVASFLLDDVDDWTPPQTKRRRNADETQTKRRRNADETTENRRRIEDAQEPTPMVLEDIADVWADAIDELSTTVSADSFATWSDKVDPGGRREDGTFVLLVDDSFLADWIGDNYRDLIEDALADADDHETADVDFEIAHEVDVQRPTS